jgi:hypothetical protein
MEGNGARNAAAHSCVSMVADALFARTAEAQAFVTMGANAVRARTAEAQAFVSMVAFAVGAQIAIVSTTPGVVRAPSVTDLKPKGYLNAKGSRGKRNVKMVSQLQKSPLSTLSSKSVNRSLVSCEITVVCSHFFKNPSSYP